MIYNKKVIIGAIITIIIIVAAIIAAIMSGNQPATQEEDASTQTAAEAPMRIENFYAYPDIEATAREAITSSIQAYLTDVPKDAAPVGVIRDGSYKETSNGTMSNTTFLVDIDSLKRTYKVSIGNDSSTEEYSVYTLCPTTDE